MSQLNPIWEISQQLFGERETTVPKYTLLAAFAIGLVASPSFAELIVRYDFNGDALDSSGLGNHGTIVGNPTFTASDSSQAISFDNPFSQQSATQFVRLPNLDLSDDSFTFALRYLSTDASQLNGRLFGNAGGNAGFTGIAHDAGSGSPNSVSTVIGSAGLLSSHAESQADPFAFTADGQWHWAVTVVDRNTSTFRYSVDEHLIVSMQFGSLGSVRFSDILIGANSFDGLNTFFGARQTAVDEFRLYNHALSPDEVRQLVTGVPEPSSLLLSCLGIASFAGCRRFVARLLRGEGGEKMR